MREVGHGSKHGVGPACAASERAHVQRAGEHMYNLHIIRAFAGVKGMFWECRAWRACAVCAQCLFGVQGMVCLCRRCSTWCACVLDAVTVHLCCICMVFVEGAGHGVEPEGIYACACLPMRAAFSQQHFPSDSTSHVHCSCCLGTTYICKIPKCVHYTVKDYLQENQRT